MDKVRYSYLQQQFNNPDEILEGIRKLLKSGAFTLGPEVEQFEKSFAALIGTKHAVGVASGTDALKLPLKALGIGHGDEVITAANTFIATAGAINEIGAKPVFVDCTKYYTMDVTKLERAITPKTKAILPVHLTGEPVDMKALMAIATEHRIPIIEDACQSILCEIDGKRAGTFGEAAGFSLHPLKNLNVWGDAGIVVTNSDEMAHKLRLLRNHGMKNRDEIEIFGFNSRLDTLQAIVGNWLIPQTKDITAQRRKNAAYYDQELMKIPGVRLAPRRPEVHQVYHLYMFEVDRNHRDKLHSYLLSKGIEAKVHYPIPLYQQEGLKFLGYKPGDFPETDRQAREILTLPVDQHLSREEADFCLHHVREYFKNGGM